MTQLAITARDNKNLFSNYYLDNQLKNNPDLKDKTKKKENTVLQKFEEEVHKPFVDKIVQQLNVLSEIDDDTIEHINQKKALFEKLKENKQYLQIKSIADVYTAVYFGNETTEVNKNPKFAYNDLFWALKGDDKEWSRKTYKPWFKSAMEIARNKSFFHWELEFPELFFEGGAPKQNPGWDAVVGNPPYVRQEQLGENKEYFYINYDSYHGVADLYVYFFERGHQVFRKSGQFGFISSNKFLKSNYGASLRHYLTNGIYLKQIIDFGELPVFPEAATFPAIFLTEKSEGTGKTTLFVQIRSLDFQSLDAVIKSSAESLLPSAFEGQNWSLGTETENMVLQKIKANGLPLKEYVNGEINFGIKTGFNEAFFINTEIRARLIAEDQKSAEVIKPLIVGDDVRKYAIHFKEKYLIFTRRGTDIEKYPAIKRYLEKFKENLMPKPKDWDEKQFGGWLGRKPGPYKWYELQDTVSYYEDFQKPKIIYPDIAITCRFCLDREGYFPEATCFEIPVDDPYLVSILNSTLVFFYIRSLTPVLGDSSQGGRLRFKSVYLKNLPIRRISFTTPADRRAALVEQAKALYSVFLSAPGTDNLDRINRIDRINASNPVNPVQAVVSISPAPDSQKILEFIGARLSAAPDESDVVRDLLAYLAERMIEMNKEKNIEIKGFLQWFEGEIGVPIEELTNKTAIKEYYEAGFDALAGVLAKNKTKLKDGYDPTRRAPKDKLQAEFNASVGKLAPLLKKIEATDGLIDQIVYKLYGLTEEEIKIVEGSISGKKDEKETGMAT